jgi:hypothetical protein
MNDTNVILSMSMAPKMLHIDYAAAMAKGGCVVGLFSAGGVSCAMYVMDDNAGSRRALRSK